MTTRRLIRNSIVNLYMVALFFVAALFIANWGLQISGFPVMPEFKVSHPANYSELRTTSEFEYVFSTNDMGLRYRRIAHAHRRDHYRVFVVGDSFTEGVGVADGERYTDRLESIYTRDTVPVEFINGGLTGTGPLQYARMFRYIGMQYQPDALLITLHANDLENTLTYLKDDWIYNGISNDLKEPAAIAFAKKSLPYLYTLLRTAAENRPTGNNRGDRDFLRALQDEATRRGIDQREIDKWKAAAPADLVKAVNHAAFDQSILGQALATPGYWLESLDVTSSLANRKWTNMEKILSGLVNLARSNRILVAVVFTPTRYQYDNDSYSAANPQVKAGLQLKAEWLTETSEIQQRIAAWANRMLVPYLDLTPVFRKANGAGRPLIFPLDGHWNSTGHSVAADAISAWLTGERVFLD